MIWGIYDDCIFYGYDMRCGWFPAYYGVVGWRESTTLAEIGGLTMIDKMNILTEENLQEIREYIVETIKRDIDRYTDDYTIIDFDRTRGVVADFVDDTTEGILQEIKPKLEQKIKRDLVKILESR